MSRPGAGLAALLLLAAFASAMTLDQFRALPDNRAAVRESFGVRSVRALGPSLVAAELGLSATPAAGDPEAWRVLCDGDPNYAFDKFVRPLKAELGKSVEARGPDGCPFPEFPRWTVKLQLPFPMLPGKRYSFVAQGTNAGEVAVGGHSAQSLVYGEEPPPSSRDVDLAVLGLRRIEPVGNGVLLLEFGPGFSPVAGSIPGNYRASVGGRRADVVNLGRVSKLDTYIPSGWPFQAIPMHEVFLQVSPAFQDGDLVSVQIGQGVSAGAASASMAFDSTKTFSNSLKVNQVGYLASSPAKVAYLGRWLGSFPELKTQGEAEFWDKLQGKAKPSATTSALSFAAPPRFHVFPERGGEPVFSGVAKLVHRSGQLDEGVYGVDHSGENVYLLDFTGLKTPGRYFVSVPGVGRSLPFKVGDDVYREAFALQARGVFAQRCGIELAPPCSTWRRIACHRDGVTLTTQLRNSPHDLRADLPAKVALEPAPPRPASALDDDPALAARYRFDGDFKDGSGHGLDLTPCHAPSFSPADPKQFRGGQVYGPTSDGAPNGARGHIKIPTGDGVSVAFWFKKPPRQKFGGFFSLGGTPGSRLQLGASWGVPILAAGEGRASLPSLKMERPADGAWHHLAAVLGAGRMELYDNGALVAAGAPGTLGPVIDGPLLVACAEGDEAGGACFADFRVYSRALQPAEVKTLATPDPATRPVVIPAYGGHHDAGDYNPRSHLDVAQTLMDAYEMAPRKFFDGQLDIPESHNGLPDILDEAFWALRLWLGLQDADGGVHNGTESAGDPNFAQTVEMDDRGDYAYAKDAEGSFLFAGALAQASRLWRRCGRDAEADDFLARAVKAYAWALAHPLQSDSAEFFGHHVAPPKAYAAAQLLHATRDPRYNRDFLAACVWTRKPDAEVDMYRQYDMRSAAWAYASCPPELADTKVQADVRRAIIRQADTFIRHCSTNAYAFVQNPWAPINWGTGAYENWLGTVVQAHWLTGDSKYLRWMIWTCDNTLGANPLNLSYVVGLGARTVRAPLHNSRYSQAGEVVDGQQVQGPNQAAEGYRVEETAYPRPNPKVAPLCSFVDCHFAISMDEGVVSSQARSMAVFGLLLPDMGVTAAP